MKRSTKGHSVTIEVRIWLDDGVIHMAGIRGSTFLVAVRPDAEKPSGHPYLYRELSKCLNDALT